MTRYSDEQAARQRRAVVDALAPPGALFEYLSADSCCVGCPICREPMRVTFRGEVVDTWCSAGCAEADVVRAAFGLGEVA
jgi:hypothetical protein